MRIAGLNFDVGAATGPRHLIWAQDYRLLGLVAIPSGTLLCQQVEGPFATWGGVPDCPWCLKEAEKLDPDFELEPPPAPDQMRLF